MTKLHRRRPAEIGAGGAGVLLAVYDALNRHDWWGAALLLVVAGTPALITWLKSKRRSK